MFEIKKNIEELTNTIIILVYKEDRDLIKSLDLECVNIFKDPLLFAYFKSKSSNTFHKAIFEEILQGYFIKKKKLKIIHSFNNKNIAYIPNIGYFKKGEQKPF
ncbi:MAG TPA: hypothetical protein VNJ50_11265, partial [Gelidibacter sp.]|uniref:hypothetical protein n=1 Tax=Gelidibacter sp. TaxID=2018083 RepID=UPI002C2DEE86